MILQRLAEYYDVLEGQKLVPPIGYSFRIVSLIIELTKEGMVSSIIPIEKTRMVVPFQKSRSGKNPPSYFLCDGPKYFLGKQFEKDLLIEYPEYVQICLENHRNILADLKDEGAIAILKFLERIVNNEDFGIQLSSDCYNPQGIVFKLEGDSCFLHERPELKTTWDISLREQIGANSEIGQCLISGEKEQLIQKTHTLLKITDGQPAGAAIVSFNLDAFTSYNKSQSANSPISFECMFKYTTALQFLLNHRDSQNRSTNKCYLNGATCIFWTTSGDDSFETSFLRNVLNKDFLEKETTDEANLSINPSNDQEEDFLDDLDDVKITVKVEDKSQEVQATINKIANGEKNIDILNDYKDTKIYILTLAPNASRIAIKFFYENSFGTFVQNIANHYERLNIVDKTFYPITPTDLFKAATRTGSLPDCPTFIKDQTLYSILNNSTYPQALYSKCLQRYRLDTLAELKETKETKDTKVIKIRNKIRIAFIKAYLMQKQLKTTKKKEEIGMSLNKENENIGYLLGRLFAVLVKVQEKAGNQTLVERYFTGASTTPRAMFTMLLKNAQNHLTKIKKNTTDEKSMGRAIYYDKIITEILSKLDNGFPTSLNQYDQGMFMLGYYQQKQSFYEKSQKTEDDSTEEITNNETKGGSDNE